MTKLTKYSVLGQEKTVLCGLVKFENTSLDRLFPELLVC